MGLFVVIGWKLDFVAMILIIVVATSPLVLVLVLVFSFLFVSSVFVLCRVVHLLSSIVDHGLENRGCRRRLRVRPMTLLPSRLPIHPSAGNPEQLARLLLRPLFFIDTVYWVYVCSFMNFQ